MIKGRQILFLALFLKGPGSHQAQWFPGNTRPFLLGTHFLIEHIVGSDLFSRREVVDARLRPIATVSHKGVLFPADEEDVAILITEDIAIGGVGPSPHAREMIEVDGDDTLVAHIE